MGEENRLDGWKEIAAFLGKSVRTVQVWEEELGLPVHREMKRVWAIPSEVNIWRQSHQELATQSETPPAPVAVTEPRWSWRLAGVVAVVIAGASALLAVAWIRPSTPTDYQTRGPVLSVYDEAHKPIWSHTFARPLNEEARSGASVLLNLRGQFVDFDQDGRIELLYRYWPWDLSKDNSALVCFNANGTVRWSFAPGRPVLKLSDGREISGTYTVSEVALLKHPRKDGGRIVVASHHSWDWPQQVAILTAEGQLVDEYWHPGWLFSLDVADLDHDGRDEILLGGVNNAYGASENRSATLLMLNAESIRGQGSAPPESRLQVAEFPVRTEKRGAGVPVTFVVLSSSRPIVRVPLRYTAPLIVIYVHRDRSAWHSGSSGSHT